MKKEKMALAIGGGIGLIIFGTAFASLTKEIKEEYPTVIETDQDTETGQQVDTGAIATAGQSFIQLMASYDQEQGQPIKLMNIEQVGDIWQAKYEVEQVFENDLSLVYFYTVDIDRGHVIRQNVSIADRSRRLLLSNPEPDSIVEQQAFTVKGQVFDEQTSVQLKLINKSNERVIVQETLKVELDNNAVYSMVLKLADNVYGEYLLELTDGQSVVQTNIVISRSE